MCYTAALKTVINDQLNFISTQSFSVMMTQDWVETSESRDLNINL